MRQNVQPQSDREEYILQRKKHAVSMLCSK